MDRAKVHTGLLRLSICYREDDGLVKAPCAAALRRASDASAKYNSSNKIGVLDS